MFLRLFRDKAVNDLHTYQEKYEIERKDSIVQLVRSLATRLSLQVCMDLSSPNVILIMVHEDKMYPTLFPHGHCLEEGRVLRSRWRVGLPPLVRCSDITPLSGSNFSVLNSTHGISQFSPLIKNQHKI